ncbi:MAG: CerR family C-terminal domain-containing protein [Pseudomonadota bacterium]
MSLKKLEVIDREKIEKRGEGKKYAILMAGLKLFGELGLNGTSVRMIADEANANIAAIAYYFSSKENLYLEVVKYIGEQCSQHIVEMKTKLDDSKDMGSLTKEEALSLLEFVQVSMLRMFIERDDPKAWAQIIMREQAKPTEAFDTLYEQFMRPMQLLTSRCVAILLDLPPDHIQVKVKLHTLVGQVLVFLVSRESFLRHLGVEKIDNAQMEEIEKVVIDNIRLCAVPSTAKTHV